MFCLLGIHGKKKSFPMGKGKGMRVITVCARCGKRVKS